MNIAGKFIVILIILMTLGQGSEWLLYNVSTAVGVLCYIITLILVIMVVGTKGSTNE
jgi:hypothetical protein